MEGAAHLGANGGLHALEMIAAHLLAEVRLQRAGIQTELVGADEVIADPILQGVAIARAERALKAVMPTQERQAQCAPSRPPKLLVDVAFFAAEAREARIEPEPRLTAAGKGTEALHGNLERLAIGVGAARVPRPDAPHSGRPDGIEVRRDAAQIVGDQRPLQEVEAV